EVIRKKPHDLLLRGAKRDRLRIHRVLHIEHAEELLPDFEPDDVLLRTGHVLDAAHEEPGPNLTGLSVAHQIGEDLDLVRRPTATTDGEDRHWIRGRRIERERLHV